VLDWISSKVAVTVAGFAILVSSIGMLFVIQLGYENIEMRNVADEITHAVNQLSSVAGNASVNFTFDPGQVGVSLPRSIRRVHYTLEFHRNLVFLHRGGVTVSSRFSENIHLWNPGTTRAATHEQIATADEIIDEWSIPSGREFKAVRRYMEGTGYLTFVYHPSTEVMQRYVDEQLVPQMDRGDTSPGSTQVAVPATYRAKMYSGMIVIEGTQGDEAGLAVRGFTEVTHLWRPTSLEDTAAGLETKDQANPGPLEANAFKVEWRIIRRTDEPCESCESGFRATPEGFAYR